MNDLGWLEGYDTGRPFGPRRASLIKFVTCGNRHDCAWVRLTPPLEGRAGPFARGLDTVLIAARLAGVTLRAELSETIHVFVCTAKATASDLPDEVAPADVEILHWGLLSPDRPTSPLLELDHVFCMVTEPTDLTRRFEDDGWALDPAEAELGLGTYRQRLAWPGHFFELRWITDAAVARECPLRLDRRSAWRETGASPFGLVLRGAIDQFDAGVLCLCNASGARVWTHRDNERFPERPLVSVLEMDAQETGRRREDLAAAGQGQPGELLGLRLSSPSQPPMPDYVGPRVLWSAGAHQLELVVGIDAMARRLSDVLSVDTR